MPKSPDILTNRLQITAFSEKYLTPRYIGWLNNPILMRYSEQRHKTHNLESCQKYYKSFEGTPNYFWALFVIDSELGHIGNVNAYVNENNKVADIGILIGEPEASGKGYATEAFKAICEFLFEKCECRKVTAGTISLNKAMLKVMKKAGMVEDGVRSRHYIWKGKEVDMIHMAIFKTHG